MDVVFLGYSDMNFVSRDGNQIDGIKFFYYYPSQSRNYLGYEVGSVFVSRQNTEKINQIKSIKPLSSCLLDMGYNGKRSIFNGIIAQ